MTAFPTIPEQYKDDPTEWATVWGLTQPHLQESLAACYRSGDLLADARRFYASQEFAETLAIFTRLGKGPDSQARVLDVGCGNGFASYALTRAGYEVTASDISEGDLAGLGGARKLNGSDGAAFSVVNFSMDSSQPESVYDIIYLRQALHHSANPAETVEGLARSLRPGGIFCAIREHVIRNRRQLECFLATHPFQPITQDEHAYTLATYRNAFQQAGLVCGVELYPFDSAINFFPGDHTELVTHLSRVTRLNLGKHSRLRHWVLRLLAYKHQLRRDQLYSFFYRKLA
ncbi:MAG: methyltransferase domain-containing protein [Chloroflexi bacterium]|nr:methyltransferase domain-containing protein [Chloroflexota bacterium]